MMIKKLLLCGMLGTATLFSTTSFAFYHTHDYYPRFKNFRHHHHHSRWRNTHRWTPPRDYIVVENGAPNPRYHQHY
ncbi:hypothetical protein [Legionella qingyii]|uniref:hypothetical protein n=1 Tax=Legionella qingyii TaxID=2184757 RepID=UPI001F23F5F3|nr:hypothetical protein [Legionella qingyii]